jgi:hypothetical protein
LIATYLLKVLISLDKGNKTVRKTKVFLYAKMMVIFVILISFNCTPGTCIYTTSFISLCLCVLFQPLIVYVNNIKQRRHQSLAYEISDHSQFLREYVNIKCILTLLLHLCDVYLFRCFRKEQKRPWIHLHCFCAYSTRMSLLLTMITHIG